ncbi:hypothetical protein [Streptosporangium pseudovulgare]|uniref:Uncharacterized protein n=1 Tax=Streptosporangium pseudovulgare TaxID=35765 RepID=A0ABQ2QHI5_9ACTN|nr:hypothetical protein [Streptosporangium pseudovulgare]GGP82192.1 hypothetical protein GCM10010140_08680 [Streptosporangium pseudovulgare]
MLQRTRAAVALTVGVGALALAPSAVAATTVSAVAATAADPVVSSVKIDPDPILVTGSPVGAEFTFTTSGAGKVDFKIKAPGGDWTPLEVKPAPHGLESKWTATKTFDTEDREGRWSYIAVAHGENGKEDTESGRFTVDVVRRVLDTRIAEFNAWPEPVRKGARLSVNGRLLAYGRHGWHGYAGRTVDILFRADGSSRWEKVGSDRTDRYGRFSESGTAERSGTWRAVFDGGRYVDGASSGTDHVRVLEPQPEPERGTSRVIRFNASPEPVRHGRYLTFTGRLQVDDSGWEGYRAKVGLYFKPAGSSKWQRVKNAWSNGAGHLYTKARAYRSGHWKFVFAGDDDFRPDSSGSDYVKVIRR